MLVTQALPFSRLGIFLYHHPRFLYLQPLGSYHLLTDTKASVWKTTSRASCPIHPLWCHWCREEGGWEGAGPVSWNVRLPGEGTLPPGWLPYCSWSHRWIIIQPAPVCTHQLLSGLQWNWATRIQPSKNRSVKFSEWRKDPYPSQVQGVSTTLKATENMPQPPPPTKGLTAPEG